MFKDVFIDKHERSNVVKDPNNFLIKIEDLKPYIIEFDEDSKTKQKNYPSDCTNGGNDQEPIIVITNEKYNFSTNNNIYRTWTRVGDTYLQRKDCRQGIITLEFLLPF